MCKLIRVIRKWGITHLCEVSLVLFWRSFPWPKERGKYFFKRIINQVRADDGFVPMWTDVGWLLLENRGDVLQHTIYMNGTHYEKEVTKFIKTQLDLRPGSIVFDVGGHVGYYTLLLAQKVGPNGKVISFEPQPHLAQAVRKSLNLNHLTWGTVENLAVSDSCREVILFQPQDSGRTSATDGTTQTTQELKAKATTLDHYVFNQLTDVPSFIKMDIEGGEWLALFGMRELLKRISPTLLIEMHPAQITALGGTQEEIVRYLQKQGKYHLYWIHHKLGLQLLPKELPQATTWHLLAKL